MTTLREALRELPDPVFADVLESEDAYLLVLDLPGVTAEDIEVEHGGGTLTVSAERRGTVPEEFEPVDRTRPDAFTAHLPLPPDAAGAEATAAMDRGVLELTVPKTGREDATTVPIDEG